MTHWPGSTTFKPMEEEYISSRKNPLIAQLRKLNAQRAFRRESGRFTCEGPKLVEEALRWGVAVEALLLVPDAPVPDKLPGDVRVVRVPEDVLASASAVESPQGVAAVCRIPALRLPDELPGGRYLILDGVQDPGNLGTIWRTADAFGADALILVNGCADPWSPKTVRATMGAAFRLPVWESGAHEAAQALKRAGLPLYATALERDTVDVRQVSLARCGVVIGSEGRGVSPQTLALCEKTIKIPMRARCESLNAAAAAGVILWEMARGE